MDISHMASGRHIETHFGVFVLDYVTTRRRRQVRRRVVT